MSRLKIWHGIPVKLYIASLLRALRPSGTGGIYSRSVIVALLDTCQAILHGVPTKNLVAGTRQGQLVDPHLIHTHRRGNSRMADISRHAGSRPQAWLDLRGFAQDGNLPHSAIGKTCPYGLRGR